MIILKVPGIMCDGCRKKILSKMQEAGIEAEVNVRFKTVSVKEEDREKAVLAIQKAGYEVIL